MMLSTIPTDRAPTSAAPTVNPDTAWQLDHLFGEQDGWAFVGTVDGDPSIKKGQPGYAPLHEEPYRWPRQRADVLERLAQLDLRGINTYVRQCLFSKKSGAQANALPSRVVWQDDVTDPHKPCSVLIQTSERKYQAILFLDRPATVAERARLAIQWHTRSPDTEDSQHASYDPAHHIRVVGGHNTKGHGRYPVTFARQSEYTYPADRLLERCTGGDTSSSSSRVSKARLDSHHAGDWKKLPDGQRLFDSKRYQAIVGGRPQLRRILVEKQRVAITTKSGQADDSDSAQVAVVIQNLRTAWSEKAPGHLPEKEIRAVALLLKPKLRPGVSLKQYQVDVDCLLINYKPKNYRPVSTRYLGARRTRGRQAGYLGAQLFATLDAIRAIEPDAFGRRIYTLAALAGERGTPRRTVQYRIKRLRETGYIVTGQIGGNGKPYAILCDGGAQHKTPILPSEQEPVLPVPTPEANNAADTTIGETECTRELCVSPDRESTCAPPTPLPLDALVRAALAALPRERLHPKTGVITRWPITAKRVLGWAQQLAPYYRAAKIFSGDWATWERAIPCVLRNIRKELRNARFAEVRDLSVKALDQQLTAVSRTIGQFERRAAAAMMPEIRAYCQAEANKRRGQLAMLSSERAERDAREARRIAQYGHSLVEQAEMRELADAAIEQMRSERTGRAIKIEPVASADSDTAMRASLFKNIRRIAQPAQEGI